VKLLQKAMGANLRYVYRNFPLGDIHPHPEHAVEAAGAQGHFWECATQYLKIRMLWKMKIWLHTLPILVWIRAACGRNRDE